MERKPLLALVAATTVVGLIAFQVGRQSAPSGDDKGSNNASVVMHSASSSHSQGETEEADLAKVTIENIGQVAFDQAYELLRGASPEALRGWVTKLESLPSGPRKTAAIKAFYKIMAQVDPKTAVDLALSLGNRPVRATAARAIQGAAPPSGFPEVARLLIALNVRGLSVIDLVLDWSRFDPVSASKFAVSHPAEVNSNALELLLTNWAATDPAAAKVWLDNLDPNRRDPDVYEGFFNGWLENDEKAALTYLVEHAGEEKLARAVRSTALALFDGSEDAARKFVVDLPKGPAQEAAVDEIVAYATGRVIGSSLQIPPEAVAKWLVTMPKDIWDKHIGYVLREWNGDNPGGAERWIDAMSLDVRDVLSAKLCLASFDWENPGSAIDLGFKITDQRLREETLRELLKDMNAKGRAELLADQVRLLPRRKAELQRIVTGL